MPATSESAGILSGVCEAVAITSLVDEVHPDTPLEEDLDDLDLVLIVEELEDRFDVQIDDEDMPRLASMTPRQIATWLGRRMPSS